MCGKSELQSILSEAAVGLADILLYGSYARDEQDEESDIDVLALVNPPKVVSQISEARTFYETVRDYIMQKIGE